MCNWKYHKKKNLISPLEKESQGAIEWFKINEMVVNPDKFQTIVVKKHCRRKVLYDLNVNNQTINPENCVKLLRIEIDNTLSFDQHDFALCKKRKQSIKYERKTLEVHVL